MSHVGINPQAQHSVALINTRNISNGICLVCPTRQTSRTSFQKRGQMGVVVWNEEFCGLGTVSDVGSKDLVTSPNTK